MGIGVENIRQLEKRGKVLSAKITSFLPDIKIDHLEENSASIDQGKDIASKDWRTALRIFGGIYKDEGRTGQERVEGAIHASQMLVNLGRLNQASGILDSSIRILSKIGNEDVVLLLSAGILEKRAWIADYSGKNKDAINFLNNAKDIYDSFGSKLSNDFEDSRSTIEHFLGRENFSIGNIDQAQQHFETDLIRYKKLRENGEPRPSGEAFNNAWLARCSAYNNELENAHEFLRKTFDLFAEEALLNSDEAVMAHYYLVSAEVALVESKPQEAFIFAKEALKIRLTKKPVYIKGGIDAGLVLSIACLQVAESYIKGFNNASS